MFVDSRSQLIKQRCGFVPVLDAFLKNDAAGLPTKTDLTEAMTSLIRLQRVYRLDVHDMFHGYYNGYQGSALDTDDAFLVSRTMLLRTLAFWTRGAGRR